MFKSKLIKLRRAAYTQMHNRWTGNSFLVHLSSRDLPCPLVIWGSSLSTCHLGIFLVHLSSRDLPCPLVIWGSSLSTCHLGIFLVHLLSGFLLWMAILLNCFHYCFLNVIVMFIVFLMLLLCLLFSYFYCYVYCFINVIVMFIVLLMLLL